MVYLPFGVIFHFVVQDRGPSSSVVIRYNVKPPPELLIEKRRLENYYQMTAINLLMAVASGPREVVTSLKIK